MDINDKAIEEFRRLYAEEFGKEISIDEARIMAKRLVALYLALAKKVPDAREWKNEKDQAA